VRVKENTMSEAPTTMPWPPEPGALVGLGVKAELWPHVCNALFDDDETLKQTIVGPDGKVAKLDLRPLRVDSGEVDHYFRMEGEVVDVLWQGEVQ
jgi:hypothetical protein